MTCAVVAAIARHCSCLTELSVNQCEDLNDVTLIHLVKSNRNLVKLSVDDCPDITDLAIGVCFQHCEGLMNVNLGNTSITSNCLVRVAEDLERLSIVFDPTTEATDCEITIAPHSSRNMPKSLTVRTTTVEFTENCVSVFLLLSSCGK